MIAPDTPQPMPNEPPHMVSQKQQLALQLLLKGYSDTRVAREVGVARETINRWRLHDSAFQEALERERKRGWDGSDGTV